MSGKQEEGVSAEDVATFMSEARAGTAEGVTKLADAVGVNAVGTTFVEQVRHWRGAGAKPWVLPRGCTLCTRSVVKRDGPPVARYAADLARISHAWRRSRAKPHSALWDGAEATNNNSTV